MTPFRKALRSAEKAAKHCLRNQNFQRTSEDMRAFYDLKCWAVEDFKKGSNSHFYGLPKGKLK